MFNEEQKLQIAQLVRQKISEKKISQDTAGNQIGVSVAYVNYWVNNKTDMFETISLEKWSAAAIWANFSTKKWATYESDNLNSIFTLCNEAQEDSRFMAVVGDTGDGKTKGLTYYANHKTTKNAYYVLCVKTMGKKDFLNAILKAIGVDFEGSLHAKIYTIIQHFKDKRNCLLILDDVGKLQEACLHLVQIIYDETHGLAGIVWGGLPSFKTQFFKLAAKDKPGYRELKRRVEYWMMLNKINDKFIVTVAADFGITDEPALKYLVDKSPDYGTFRNLMEQYERDVPNNPKLSPLAILKNIRMGTADVGENTDTKKKK